MKPKSPEEQDHVLHNLSPCEECECQPSSQRRRREGNERCVGYIFFRIQEKMVVKLEVLEVRKEPNEIHDLPGGAAWSSEGKEPKCRRKVSEALPKIWHETGYLETIYSEFLEVLERGKVTQIVSAEPFGSEPAVANTTQADAEPLNELK